jgi:hypothetical protein
MNTNEDNYKNLIDLSYNKIYNYKLQNIELYKLILDICNERNIIISNNLFNIRFNLNLDNSLNSDFNIYDYLDSDNIFNLYSFNPKGDGIYIANQIYLKYSKYVFLSSFLYDKEIIITINNNKLIKINLLFEQNKNIKNTIKLLYNQKNNLYYLPNYIELFYLAHKLYNPSYFINYIKNIMKNNDSSVDSIGSTGSKIDTKIDTKIIQDSLLNKLDNYTIYLTLVNNLINDLISNKYLKDYVGLGNLIIKDKYIKERNLITNIKNIIIIKFLNKINNNLSYINFIALEQNAIDLLNYYLTNSDNNNLKFSFNTNNNFSFIIDNIKENINKIKESINKIISNEKDNIKDFNTIILNLNIKIQTSSFYITNDFRLKKYQVKLHIKFKNGNEKIINLMTFYNSIDYELIPIVYEYNNIKVPHKFVIIRFLLINYITMQLFDKNYEYNKKNIDNNIRIILNECIKLNDYNKLKKNISWETIYFLGSYNNEKTIKYQLGSFIYRPWQYFIQNNTLK